MSNSKHKGTTLTYDPKSVYYLRCPLTINSYMKTTNYQKFKIIFYQDWITQFSIWRTEVVEMLTSFSTEMPQNIINIFAKTEQVSISQTFYMQFFRANKMRSFFFKWGLANSKLICQISPYILGKLHGCRMLMKFNGKFFAKCCALATFCLANKGW
jgi:hypothetical protein